MTVRRDNHAGFIVQFLLRRRVCCTLASPYKAVT